MPTWTLALKDLRLLLRDTRAVVVLLAMPLIFMTVLGLALGEGFGQKPDDRLRASMIQQVAQVALLRVILPWMIGRGFDEVTRQMPLVTPVIERLFPRYSLRAKTWSALTRAKPPPRPGEPTLRGPTAPSAAVT